MPSSTLGESLTSEKIGLLDFKKKSMATKRIEGTASEKKAIIVI